MQSYWMQMTDTAAVLELRDATCPQPGPRQLLVRMRAAALNRGEFVAGHGLHGAAGSWKAIGGEGAGEVVAVGRGGHAAFKPGDRVMGRCAGAFAEYALMEAAEAMAVPAALSWEAGRQRPADLPRRLRHAGAAGAPAGRRMGAGQRRVVRRRRGVAAARARRWARKVIGTSGSADKLERLQPLGLDVGHLHARSRLRRPR